MAFRLVNIYLYDEMSADVQETIASIEGVKQWNIRRDHKNVQYSFLVEVSKTQLLTDKLQPLLNKDNRAQIVVMPVATTIPVLEEEPQDKPKEQAPQKKTISREELFAEVSKGATLDKAYLLMVLLSTIVAAIGLLENNVAVVIGAMVIAPLLGPNLAFALGTVLGDSDLLGRAFRTNCVGLGIAILLSVGLGVVWTGDLAGSQEFMARTDVGMSGIVLAIASGAAAVLSLVSGTSSALVGVMVAVALLPPAVVFGVSFGAGEFTEAFGAFMLLAANVICVNLSAIWVFIFKGVKPLGWREKKQAILLSRRYLFIWLSALFCIIIMLIVKHNFF